MSFNAIEKLETIAQIEFIKKHPNVPKHALPKTKYTEKTTNGLTKCVIDFIRLDNFQAERINSTGKIIDNRKTVTDVLGRKREIGSLTWAKNTGQTGTADISATIKGRSVKIEIKCKATNDRYQSAGQKAYQKEIEAAGGIYIIVRTFDGFYDWYIDFINKN